LKGSRKTLKKLSGTKTQLIILGTFEESFHKIISKNGREINKKMSWIFFIATYRCIL